MNKILLFAFILSGTIFNSLAQTKSGPQLSIGGEFGLPTGPASQIYGSVFGASVKLELPVKAIPVKFTITAGFSSFLVRYDYTGFLKNVTYIPVKLGGKYYINRINRSLCELRYTRCIISRA